MAAEPNSVQSIRRTFNLLSIIGKYEVNGLRLSDLARKADLPITTTRRLLMELVNQQFIKFDQAIKRYFPGPKMYTLGAADRYALYRNAYRDILNTVAQKTGETAYFALRVGYDILCLDHVQSHHTIRVVVENGERIPLGLGGCGLSIMSTLTDAEANKILKINKKRYVKENSVTLQRMHKALEISRKLGFGWSEGIHTRGTNSIGVVVTDRAGMAQGAIGVASMRDRMTRKRAAGVAEIIKAELLLIDPIE